MSPDLLAKLKILSEYYHALNDTYRANAYDAVISGAKPGARIQKKIDEFNNTGDIVAANIASQFLDSLKSFSDIYGIGPKLAADLISRGYHKPSEVPPHELSPASRLCIRHSSDLSTKIPRDEVTEIVASLHIPNKYWICGSYRRGSSYSGDVDIVVLDSNGSGNSNNIITSITNNKTQFVGKLSSGNKRFTFLWKGPTNITRHIDIMFVKEDEVIPSILHFTGSRAHNTYMRSRAKIIGMKLNEKGLWKDNLKIELKKEEDIYEILGIKYVDPEHRNA
jgi:DNA polymerase/3'-5' exonuclease PolX